MLKRWCSIKEIEVYLLCEILTSKDTPRPKKLLRASIKKQIMKCQLFRKINKITGMRNIMCKMPNKMSKK